MTSNATTADQEATFPGARFDPATMTGSAPLRYVYRDRRIPLAVNVALATGRPLLVTGDPGSGKTTLAADVAGRLGWAHVSEPITSRTRIADLIARFDAVQRLSDAQAGSVRPEAAYLRPGVLWWAFGSVAQQDAEGATLPEVGDDVRDLRVHPEWAEAGVVVLLDEIDKAEPELPNDLLTPLDTLSVEVPGRAGAIRADPSRVLIVITSNGERQMPPAFLRWRWGTTTRSSSSPWQPRTWGPTRAPSTATWPTGRCAWRRSPSATAAGRPRPPSTSTRCAPASRTGSGQRGTATQHPRCGRPSRRPRCARPDAPSTTTTVGTHRTVADRG